MIRLFDVSGKFVIPGTRIVETFKARIAAETPEQGSKDLAPVLQKMYQRDLPRHGNAKLDPRFTITPAFVRRNLNWSPWTPPASTPDPIGERSSEQPWVASQLEATTIETTNELVEVNE